MQPDHKAGSGRRAVLACIKEDPYVSYRDMARQTGLAVATVQYHVEKMRADGVLAVGDCPTCHRPGRLKLRKGAA